MILMNAALKQGSFTRFTSLKSWQMKNLVSYASLLFVLIGACHPKADSIENKSSILNAMPDSSYWNKPIETFDTSDYVVQLKHMQEFYDVPGEFGHIAEGKDYGFKSLSFILTNTHPHGGPPLHKHETEEAHILHEGSIQYTMGGQVFSAQAPYVIRIPSGVPHTFINTTNKPLHLTAVFPSNSISYEELGRNPLVQDTTVYIKKRE
jgi:mannose-6-phosphate isomerase-like protein (cupin superfamily)